MVHDEEVAMVHERVEGAVDDSEDDAQVVEVEVREQEAVHDSVVVGGNMDSNLEVEVHGRPTPHSPRRQVQLLTPLKWNRSLCIMIFNTFVKSYLHVSSKGSK